jgi:hypothetical protein
MCYNKCGHTQNMYTASECEHSSKEPQKVHIIVH